MPEVLERSSVRLSDVKGIEKGVASEGILVKLFPVLHKDTRPVGDSARFLCVVEEPNAGSEILSKQKDAQKITANTAPAAKAGLTHGRTRAKLKSRANKRGTLLVKDGREPRMAEKRGKSHDTELDDAGDEEDNDSDDSDNRDDDSEELGEGSEDEDEEEIVRRYS